jgi:hypothetical protein
VLLSQRLLENVQSVRAKTPLHLAPSPPDAHPDPPEYDPEVFSMFVADASNSLSIRKTRIDPFTSDLRRGGGGLDELCDY